jgi:hypothetical protein
LQVSRAFRKYFEPSEDPTAEDESHEEMPYAEPPEDPISEDESDETRYAELLEVAHTALDITRYNWEKFWQSKGAHERPLKGPVASSIFFDRFICAPKNRTATALQ